jgi:hypothetical protein
VNTAIMDPGHHASAVADNELAGKQSPLWTVIPATRDVITEPLIVDARNRNRQR